jgi:hypothetical protein
MGDARVCDVARLVTAFAIAGDLTFNPEEGFAVGPTARYALQPLSVNHQQRYAHAVPSMRRSDVQPWGHCPGLTARPYSPLNHPSWVAGEPDVISGSARLQPRLPSASVMLGMLYPLLRAISGTGSPAWASGAATGWPCAVWSRRQGALRRWAAAK